MPPAALAGDLLEAQVLTTKSAQEAGQVLELGSWLLATQFNTKFLDAEGYDRWRESRLASRNDTMAVRIRFAGTTPGGERDLQSGLLLLPTGTKAPAQRDWVIFHRGSELDRNDAPSRLGSAELPLAWLLASLGHSVWMPDYAGAGDGPGFQYYCVPASLASSGLDGLQAARTWAKANAPATDNGTLRVFGYSEGGLATMSAVQAWSTRPVAVPGLTLTDAYVLGAPLDLTKGYEASLDGTLVLSHPHYTVALVAGWAKTFPQQIRPADILRADVLSQILPLEDGEHTGAQIHQALATLRSKAVKTLTIGDVFSPEFLTRVKADPLAEPYMKLRLDARLDQWVPPASVRLTLAASLTDELVPAQNSLTAYQTISSQNPGSVRLLTLASPGHVTGGEEALFYAVMDVDRKTAAR
jgi:hypothetical protein